MCRTFVFPTSVPFRKDQLTGILTFHVVSGQLMAADLSDGQMLTTVNGAVLQVSITDAGVQLLDASGNTLAAVSATDTEASNGVIHTIGAVMLPPSTPAPPMNIVEIAESVDTFSTLVAALTAADLVETLSGPGPFTVFAPTNASFAALAPGTLDSLLLEENQDLRGTKGSTHHGDCFFV